MIVEVVEPKPTSRTFVSGTYSMAVPNYFLEYLGSDGPAFFRGIADALEV